MIFETIRNYIEGHSWFLYEEDHDENTMVFTSMEMSQGIPRDMVEAKALRYVLETTFPNISVTYKPIDGDYVQLHVIKDL